MKITRKDIDDLDISKLDSCGTYELLEKLTQVKEEIPYECTKFVCTGNIGFCDYSTGFLCISLRVRKIKRFNDLQPCYIVRMSFLTVDDGDYAGETDYMTEEKANACYQKIKDNVLAKTQTLPTLIEFNNILLPYGIQVGYE